MISDDTMAAERAVRESVETWARLVARDEGDPVPDAAMLLHVVACTQWQTPEDVANGEDWTLAPATASTSPTLKLGILRRAFTSEDRAVPQ